MNIIIPLGGIGNRFKSEGFITPKPLIRVLGKEIIFWLLDNLHITNENIIIPYNSVLDKYNFRDIVQNRYDFNITFLSINYDTRGASETILISLNNLNETTLRKPTLILDSDVFFIDDIIQKFHNSKDNRVFFFHEKSNTDIFSFINHEDNIVKEIKEKKRISNNACVGAYGFNSGVTLKNTIEKILTNNQRVKNEYYISSIYSTLLSTNEIISCEEIFNFYSLGTPLQIKSFASFYKQNEKSRYCFDLDNTIVTFPQIKGDYSSVLPINRNINFINKLYDDGHYIIIHTARRMKTHKNDINKVIDDISNVTIEKLKEFGVKYNEIIFGKPYADFYIDDKAINVFSDLEMETGNFNSYIEPRNFNKIIINDLSIIKSGNIDGEKFYYENLPNELKKNHPNILNSSDSEIEIDKILGLNLSYLYANKSFVKGYIDKIFNYFDEIHSYSTTNPNINIYLNYQTKLHKRYSNFNYNLISNSSKDIYIYLTEQLNKYQSEDNGICGIIHGDCVLSNIILDNNNNLKFIDMRGKLDDKFTIYGDIFYDFAKLYQSIIGYDFILNNKTLDINYINIYLKYFEQCFLKRYNKMQYFNLKLLTASLYFTLIPLHDDADKINEYFNICERLINDIKKNDIHL